MKIKLIFIKYIILIFSIIFLPPQIFGDQKLSILKGMMDLGKGPQRSEKGFEKWIDSGGKKHVNNIFSKGLMSYSIDGKEYYHGIKQDWALTIHDSRINGIVVGTFEIYKNEKKIGDQDYLIWRGHFKVEQTNGFSFGFFWGVGKNSNKGKIIEFTFDEDEKNFGKNSKNPNIYFINGFTTDEPNNPL